MLNIDDRLIKETSPKIGANALSVLLAIAIHLNQKTNRCFPSHYRLMELTGLGRDAVYSALSRLQKEGLLRSEQKIDSKKKTFSRRVFRVSTRFIQVFMYAEDMEPLPEKPDTGQPDTGQPDTDIQETYQINEFEQINKFEQINEREHAPPANLNTETPTAKNEVAPPSPAPRGWMPVDPTAEIEAMRTDDLCRERFFTVERLPLENYDAYLDRFLLKVKSEQHGHNNRRDFRNHFFSWARLSSSNHGPAKSTTPTTPNPNGPPQRATIMHYQNGRPALKEKQKF